MVPTSRSKLCKTTSPNSGWYYGVDGCKGGWILASYSAGELSFSFYETMAALVEATGVLNTPDTSDGQHPLLIDIPIGLPDSGERVCDREGRELLGSRRSTLFPVPVRPAVYARSFEECGERNVVGQGKRVSLQFWNIAQKVIEVDQLLHRSPELVGMVSEGHPELAFRRLAGRVLSESKHTSEGRAIRDEIIKRSVGEKVRSTIDQFLHKCKKYCSESDLLDAASLALLSSIHAHTPSFVGDGALDSHMIPMRIAS